MTPPSAAFEEEEDMFASGNKRNPWVPAGAFLTAGVLAAGLYAFKKGNTQRSQQLMRARVVAQGVTIAIMAASVGAGGFSLKG
ncbi:hypoxia-responsive family protein [Klebsormidium nitens]|uniref:Hypoxia-responsive family protein n=1 Tax=Klebsormidium nitens TaxID=105231 RepID=A0A1Y1IJR8_KLENI|nr:hypoxia-responsive family protein [Klebsormidium nitens]|eukprot:GAQ88877.1 hypoxia-responsive family protein [Klebsormidium nitens]